MLQDRSICYKRQLKNCRVIILTSGTMMCYGQTGAGKTFTMCGATENYAHRGIIPRAISQLFKEIEDRPEYAITCR